MHDSLAEHFFMQDSSAWQYSKTS